MESLLKFFVEEDKTLRVKIKCEKEGDPQIGIRPDGTAVVKVDDFEIDYENSGKLWFNQLDIYYGSDDKEETKLGLFLVRPKDEDEVINVIVKPLWEVLGIPGTFFGLNILYRLCNNISNSLVKCRRNNMFTVRIFNEVSQSFSCGYFMFICDLTNSTIQSSTENSRES